MTTPPSATEDTSPATDNQDCSQTDTSLKALLKTGASDFRVVFLYPLCTGIMTGVGFILGKRLGEKYFYGAVGKSP